MKSQYNTARTALMLVTVVSMFWVFFGNSSAFPIPFISTEAEGLLAIATTLLLLIVLLYFWTLLDWYKLPVEARNVFTAKVDVNVSTLLMMVAVTGLIWRLFPELAVWKINAFVSVGLIFLGWFIGSQLSTIFFTVAHLRALTDARQTGLIRTPMLMSQIFAILVALFLIWPTSLLVRAEPNSERQVWAMAVAATPAVFVLFRNLVKVIAMPKATKYELKQLLDFVDAQFNLKHIELKWIGDGPPPKVPVFQPLCEEELNALELQLKSGLNPNEPSFNGWTNFMISAANNDQKAFDLLLQFGGDVNVANAFGRTAIHYVASYGNNEMLRKLIENGTDINATCQYKETAIMRASERGNLDTLQILLANGADPSLTDITGKSAVEYATMNEHGECAALLRKALLNQ